MVPKYCAGRRGPLVFVFVRMVLNQRSSWCFWDEASEIVLQLRASLAQSSLQHSFCQSMPFLLWSMGRNAS